MKQFKKILVLGLVLAILFSLAVLSACNSSGDIPTGRYVVQGVMIGDTFVDLNAPIETIQATLLVEHPDIDWEASSFMSFHNNRTLLDVHSAEIFAEMSVVQYVQVSGDRVRTVASRSMVLQDEYERFRVYDGAVQVRRFFFHNTIGHLWITTYFRFNNAEDLMYFTGATQFDIERGTSVFMRYQIIFRREYL